MEQESRTTAPRSIEAERSVLGSMLIDPGAMDLALEELKGEDFFLASHQEIFTCMQNLRNQSQSVDTVLLVAELDRVGKLAMVGDVAYVTELSLVTPSAANVQHYIDIVQERSVQRQLIRAGNEIVRDGMNTAKALEETLNDAERRIFDISMQKSADTLRPVQDSMYDVYTHIGELMNLKGGLTGIPTGFIDLDDKLSGLQRSDLVIVAGRPSMGKTSLALNIAQHVALKEKKTVVIFSLEMSREQLITRLYGSEAEVDMQRILTGKLNDRELGRIADVLTPMQQSKLYIDDTAAVTVSDIRSKCRRLKAREGLDLIVIDYLQLMQASRRVDSRQLEISEITRGLKILARELDVPMILLSQLSRGPEQRADHRPMMADLRESGAIEQDADVIMLIYREQAYDPDADNVAEINVAKHRNGPTGVVKLAWLGELTKFKNLAREDYDY